MHMVAFVILTYVNHCILPVQIFGHITILERSRELETTLHTAHRCNSYQSAKPLLDT